MIRLLQLHVFLLILFFDLNILNSQCVNPTPSGSGLQEFCAVDAMKISDLAVTGGSIEWYLEPSGGTPLDTSELLQNTTYFADDISGGGCSVSRLQVEVKVFGQPPSNVNISINVCGTEQVTISNLSATGNNIKWFSEEYGGVLLNNSTPLEDGKTYWVQQTENGCTSIRKPTLVNFKNVPIPSFTTDNLTQEFCSSIRPIISDLNDEGYTIKWYPELDSTIPLDEDIALIDGEDYWAANVDQIGCESPRIKIMVVIDEAPNAGSDFSFDVCTTSLQTTPINLFDFLEGNPSTTGQWTGPSELTNGHLGTYTSGINISGQYTYTVTSNFGLCDSASAMIIINEIDTSKPTTNSPIQEFCGLDNITVDDLEATGNNIVWYKSPTDTTPLDSSTLLSDGTTYYATQTDSSTGCESSNRLQVTVSLSNCDINRITIYEGFSPNGDGINDSFHVENIDLLFPNYSMKFYNRWGNLVYTCNATKPKWNGQLNGNGRNLPVGVYYFIIEFNDQNNSKKQGRLYLSR